MFHQIIKKVTWRVRQRLVLSYLFEKLTIAGIRIEALYVTREFPLDGDEPDLKPKLAPLEPGFLSLAEIEKVCAHPESKWFRASNDTCLKKGFLCFGLKHKGDVVAYMWCDSNKNSGENAVPLKEKEAYLHGAFTFNAYRGEKLAPFLRSELYKQLKPMGYTKFYSFTNVFNTPAIKFKKKLKAKPTGVIINIRLFKKYHWKFSLRSPKDFRIAI